MRDRYGSVYAERNGVESQPRRGGPIKAQGETLGYVPIEMYSPERAFYPRWYR